MNVSAIKLLITGLLVGLAGLWPHTDALAQLKQTIRGVVTDAASETPLIGATVQTTDSLNPLGAYTDDQGRFELLDVPVGRVTLKITYVGYEPLVLPNLLLTSGKELIINVKLKEEFINTDAVEITAEQNLAKAQNELSFISARTLNMADANKYAGSLGDPSRMAQNFAGVASAGDSRNDIVIRGNSPLGLLWRFEGIDIPNPNHFTTQGSNGGPVSILNNNLLANSDFFTGAFPAEYGNASSGVFDLKLRNGNAFKHEQAIQIGFNGFEGMAEGPIGKKTGASYLLSYRYSTLALFYAMGLQFGEVRSVPRYQDLSFKINLPMGKAGTLSVFGMGGLSAIDILESELSDEKWNTENLDYNDVRMKTGMGVAGISYTNLLDDKSNLKVTLSWSADYRSLKVDSLGLDRSIHFDYGDRTLNQTQQLALQYNRKFNSRHSLRVGGFYKRLGVDMQDSVARFIGNGQYRTFPIRDLNESSYIIQGYAQWLWRATPTLSFTAGVHGYHFVLNGETVAEPRAGAVWQFAEKHSLNLGYGMHHQLQPLAIYFTMDEGGNRPNENMPSMRANHLVLGYNWTPWNDFRVKVEGYVQWLDKVPVDPFASSFSMLNVGAGFNRFPDKLDGLSSTGTGRNYGVELTVEKFFSKNYYFLLTGSLFNSEYTASNGRTYNTAFNNNYVVNLLGGYEYPLGQSGRYTLYANIRLTTAGGMRYTPFDFEASRAANATVLLEDEAWSAQTRPYFRADVTVGVRMNFKKWSQEFAFLGQNILNTQNVFTLDYNQRSGQIVERLQTGLFPIAFYKVTF